jgi:TctA family transporter
MTEQSLRQSLQLSRGSMSVFLNSPIAMTLLAMGVALFVLIVWQRRKPSVAAVMSMPED